MTTKQKSAELNDEVRVSWDENAAFWDERMGEGNEFFDLLVWPATELLLDIGEGERVLDVACGNGVTSRRLAASGADVVAVDFSARMIELARSREVPKAERLHYDIVDATDADALASLGHHGRFDAVLCSMALFDMAEIDPLMRAVPELLAAGGRFVFSMLHPCFNNPSVVHVGELHGSESDLEEHYSVKISAYQSASSSRGIAMPDQPTPHRYFHRPLKDLLGAAFEAGLVLDGLEERAFPPEYRGGSLPLSWNGRYSEIPPVLVARMRPR